MSEPPGDELPTREQLDVHGDLDGGEAAKHFLGKSLAEAEALFRDAFNHHVEDLMWMGPVGFRFYVGAALSYLQRAPPECVDEAELSSLHVALDFRDPTDFGYQLRDTLRFIDHVLDNYGKFDTDCTAFGDQRPKYKALRAKLTAQQARAT